MQDKVCVVVVTYNRLELLKRLISCLEDQSYPVADIIIVNNGSTDGTKNWLEGQRYKVIHQENCGSAGGFYSGIKNALQGSFDYIWIMDDDGHPSGDCLKQLVNSRARNTLGNDVVLCSMVVNDKDSSQLSFPLPNLSSRYIKLFDHYREQTDAVSDVISFGDPNGYPWGLFFNSILLPVNVIKKVGLPKKELFIWGDEVEYFNRIKAHGFKMYMIPDSLFYHPVQNMQKPVKWKDQYRVRNYAYIHKLYKPLPMIHHLSTLFKIVLKRRFYLLKPFFHGLKGNFSQRYH